MFAGQLALIVAALFAEAAFIANAVFGHTVRPGIICVEPAVLGLAATV